MSVFGLQPTTTLTPTIPSNSPKAIRFVTFWPSIGAAKRTVKTGLTGMIREASLAAVHFMPCMKRSWYAIVPSSPNHTV
jgi:hypothetical protein